MSNLNPYPQGQKSETSAESILDWIDAEIAEYLLWEKEATKEPNVFGWKRLELMRVADEIRRRIAAEAEKKAKAFAGGTEL